MGDDEQYLYGGISGVELSVDSFDLGHGVTLKKTYVYMFAPWIMSFAPAGPKGLAKPVKGAEGGFAFEVLIELRVPREPVLGTNIDARETIWWIAALLRILGYPYLTVPLTSDQPFDVAAKPDAKPTLEPFETSHRILVPIEKSHRRITHDVLEYAQGKWLDLGRMLQSNKGFYSVVKAFDYATVRYKTSSSLIALWGAIEQLFSPSPGELRYRVASLLASYLEPPGEARLKLYERIKKLYDERSTAAHTARDVGVGPVVETYVLLRNVLVQIIDENRVPTQQDLEERLFGADWPRPSVNSISRWELPSQ